MRKTKRDLIDDFSDILDNFNSKYPLSANVFNHLYKKRIYSSSLLLRPFLSKLVYEIGGKQDWKSHSRLFALVEIINISTYQSNLAFDNKNGIKNETDKFNQIIASFFSTFIFFDEIITSKYENPKRIELIEATVKSLEEIYYGQYLDLNELTFSTYSQMKSFEEFEVLYLSRCSYLGSSLIALCIKYCLILNDSRIDEIKKELIDFGKLFGLAGQILNDLGDLTSKGRVYSLNKYSDIENERMTLPIFYLMKIGGFDKPNKSELLTLCSNDKAITDLIETMKKYLENYVIEIDKLMIIMQNKGFDIENIAFLSKMLQKSNFLKLKNYVY